MGKNRKSDSKINTIANKCADWLDRYSLLCLFVVFVVFLFSRLYHLDITPAGIHYDEAGMAFDAKSLAAYGTDRHNNSLPFYLPAYGGGQSALYAYSLAVILKFVPFSMFVMRLPAVLYGCLAFFSSYFLVRDIWGDKRWGLMGPVFVTITPYFFSSERWALDCNLFLSLATFSFYMFYRAHVKGKIRDYVFAGLALGLTLYTYVLSYIVIPIFLILVFIYIVFIRKFELRKYVCMGVPLGIMALPLAIMQLINMGKIKPFSFLIWDFPKLGFYRGAEMSLSAIPGNINRLWMMFFRGEQFSFTVIPHFNPVYIVMVPFILLGFVLTVISTVNSIRKKELTVYPFILSFTVAGYLMVMMIKDTLNIYTGNELYAMYVLYSIIAMKWIHEKCIIAGNIGACVTPTILCILALCFLRFSNYYFRHYNEEYGIQDMFVSTEYGDVVKFTNEHYNPNNSVIYYGRSPKHQSYGEVIVGMALGANPKNWEDNYDNNNMVENVYLGLPEDGFDMNEDAVYIFSKENYGHIYPYFIEQGWMCDDSWESYAVVFR